MSKDADTKQLIINFLKFLKNKVVDDSGKRFIYFICSRERVRFNLTKKPSYNPFTGNKKIHVLVGENKKEVSIKFKSINHKTGIKYNPKITLRDKYITITDFNGDISTISIHDFLESENINLGIDSKVEYVGLTKKPESRPTNGGHAGLNDVIYNISDEKKDLFIYFNVFRVYSKAINDQYNFNFILPNSMIDEIKSGVEGNILEKCFIIYFNSENQMRNKVKEYNELRRSLIKIAKENKINSINVSYSFNDVNEYGVFSSSNIPPKDEHLFTVKNNDGKLEVEYI